ncbi:MAG: Gfo/Idh/MocA family protein [Chloroflexota bacterium]
MASIQAGVIGLGFIGPAHVEAIRRLGQAEVIAVAGSRPGNIRARAAQLGVPRAYDDWRDLIADPDVQVVHNCGPNFLHHAINMAAIEAGKAIVSEKPLGMDAAEAAEMLQAAREAEVIHAVCFHNRMYPLTQEMRARVRRGDLGQLRVVQGAYLQDWLLYDTDYNWRVDAALGGRGRTLGDIGTHWCDLAQFVTGQKISAVYADLATFVPVRRNPGSQAGTFAAADRSPQDSTAVEIDTEDYGAILLQFQGGARGVCTVAQLCAGHKNSLTIEINGAQGSLAWSFERLNELWIGHRGRPNEVLAKDPSLLTEAARPFAHYPGQHDEGYPDAFKNLFGLVYAAVRDGGQMPASPPWPDFEAGYEANRLVDAILQSAREQRWIAIE